MKTKALISVLALLTLYASAWAGIIVYFMSGGRIEMVLGIQMANAWEYTSTLTRIAVLFWAVALWLTLGAALLRRRYAGFAMIGVILIHLAAFIPLTANPYYDATAGYFVVSLELLLTPLLFSLRADRSTD